MQMHSLSIVVAATLVGCRAVPSFAVRTPADRTEGQFADAPVASNAPAELSAARAPLSPALAPSADPVISGWLRPRYASSGDVDVDPASAGTQQLGGFGLDSARLAFSGQAADGFVYTVSLEAGHQGLLDTGGVGVTVFDAYATVALGDQAQVIVGKFASNFLWSTNIEERRLLFLDRNFAGENTDNRDLGLEFSGAVGRFNGWAALQNASDGAGAELALSARASVRLIGDQPCTLQEGTCEPTQDATQLLAGVACFDDSNLREGTALAADLWFVHAPFSACAELVGWGDDIRPLAGVDLESGTLVPVGTGPAGSRSSASVTVAWMLSPPRWELAARWQNLDDAAATSVWSASLNRYSSLHDAKWTLQFDSSNSDDPALEADTLAIGLTVGI